MGSEKPSERAAFRKLHPMHLKTKGDLEKAVNRSEGTDLWIVFAHKLTQLLSDVHFAPRKAPELIILGDVPQSRLEILRSFFSNLIYQEKVRLPFEQLAEVMAAENRSDLLIGGEVDEEGGVVLLYRGDLTSLLVPLTAFLKSGDGIVPDFGQFSIEDHGQVLSFGEYEASAESILYEFDADYRKRYRKNLVKTGKGLGASIRRLRLHKGLRQTDFKDVNEKEIRRLEAGEVKKPHQSTLQKIAATLGVAVDKLGTF